MDLITRNIELAGPLDLPGSLSGLQRWGDDLLDRWDGQRWIRALRIAEPAVPALGFAAGSTAFPVLTITASAETGSGAPPVSLALCQTNPQTGQCQSVIGTAVTVAIDSHATPTFSVFVTAAGIVPFDPAINRIFVRFTDAAGVTRGETSVAVRTL